MKEEQSQCEMKVKLHIRRELGAPEARLVARSEIVGVGARNAHLQRAAAILSRLNRLHQECLREGSEMGPLLVLRRNLSMLDE